MTKLCGSWALLVESGENVNPNAAFGAVDARRIAVLPTASDTVLGKLRDKKRSVFTVARRTLPLKRCSIYPTQTRRFIGPDTVEYLQGCNHALRRSPCTDPRNEGAFPATPAFT